MTKRGERKIRRSLLVLIILVLISSGIFAADYSQEVEVIDDTSNNYYQEVEVFDDSYYQEIEIFDDSYYQDIDIVECTVPLDCKDPSKPVCTGGVCVADIITTPECDSLHSCPAGKTCSASGTCVTGGGDGGGICTPNWLYEDSDCDPTTHKKIRTYTTDTKNCGKDKPASESMNCVDECTSSVQCVYLGNFKCDANTHKCVNNDEVTCVDLDNDNFCADKDCSASDNRDKDPAIPIGGEICNNGKDDDCDGKPDEKECKSAIPTDRIKLFNLFGITIRITYSDNTLGYIDEVVLIDNGEVLVSKDLRIKFNGLIFTRMDDLPYLHVVIEGNENIRMFLTPGGKIIEIVYTSSHTLDKIIIKDSNGDILDTFTCGTSTITISSYDFDGDGDKDSDDKIEADCATENIKIVNNLCSITPEDASCKTIGGPKINIDPTGKVSRITPNECTTGGWAVCKGFCNGIPLTTGSSGNFCCPDSGPTTRRCNDQPFNPTNSIIGVDDGTGTVISCATEKQNPACSKQSATNRARVVSVFSLWNILVTIGIITGYYVYTNRRKCKK